MAARYLRRTPQATWPLGELSLRQARQAAGCEIPAARRGDSNFDSLKTAPDGFRSLGAPLCGYVPVAATFLRGSSIGDRRRHVSARAKNKGARGRLNRIVMQPN